MAKGNILVVDDDSNLLEVIRMRLESAKYDVVTAQQEEEALNALNSTLLKELSESAIELWFHTTNNPITLT